MGLKRFFESLKDLKGKLKKWRRNSKVVGFESDNWLGEVSGKRRYIFVR